MIYEPDADDFEETTYGYRWAQVKVERMHMHEGQVCILVSTPMEDMEVRVTLSGLIRTTKRRSPKTEWNYSGEMR